MVPPHHHLFSSSLLQHIQHLGLENRVNGLDLICRAHQLVQEGLKFNFGGALVTVWSAPNYCYRCGNVAALLCFDSALGREVKYFTETEANANMMAPRAAVPYFL